MNRQPVYLVLGSAGILGNAFLNRLDAMSSSYRVFEFIHEKVDITEPGEVNPVIEYIRPTVVINCAAINNEDFCQEAKSGAFRVNSKGPQVLAESCDKYGAKLVHFSSAHVFDGSRCTPYTERIKTNPINILGQSKISGEEAIKKTTDNYLIVRPGWVFSADYSWVTEWIAAAERDEPIAVIEDEIGSPVYAPDLVDATLDLLAREAKGLFHVSNSNAATRAQVLEATLELSNIKTKVERVTLESQKLFKAPLPRYTCLSNKKYNQFVGKEIRSWTDALKHCLFTMQKYRP